MPKSTTAVPAAVLGMVASMTGFARVEGEVAIAHTRRQALPNPNPVPQAPIRVQRMALIVESGAPSFIPRLLAVIAIAGVILLMFREETRKQLNDILEAEMSSYKVSSAE